MTRVVRQSLAVVQKELRSELRNRFGLNSMGMFIVTLLLVLLFSVGRTHLTPSITAALLFISFYVMAVSGLGRTFLAEQERGTILLLRSATSGSAVFIGKLLYNIGLSLLSNLIFVALFVVVIPGVWTGSVAGLILATVVLSVGFAAALTIVSALLARAAEKGMLTAVLALPIILPLVFLGVEILGTGAGGKGLTEMGPELSIMATYTIVLVALSFVLFDLIWKD